MSNKAISACQGRLEQEQKWGRHEREAERYTHTPFFSISGWMMGMAVAALIPGSVALGQTARYRVVDITEIGFLPTDTEGTAGINNYGQVAFGYKVGGNIHAFAWFPAASGSIAQGLHDLHDSGQGGQSIAHDINMESIVAGQYGGIGMGTGSANVWTIGSSITRTSLGNLGGWGLAWSLNDEADPVVVGIAGKSHHCECTVDTQRNEDVERAFKIRFESPLGSMTELSTGGSTVGGSTGAYDLTTPTSGNPVICGFRICDDCGALWTCQALMDAAEWNTSGVIGSLDDLNLGAEARAINSSGNNAGWVEAAGSGIGVCHQQATYWVGTTDTQLPMDTGITAARAEGLNNLNPPQIVGWYTQASLAVLWENISSTWTQFDLNNEIGTCDPDWTLLQAHDINDSGWIICVGSKVVDSVTKYHALLLIPHNECIGDINGDSCIDTDDLLVVINGWGSCDQGQICWGDLNCDNVVDVDDLLLVTNNWCNDEEPESCEDPCCAMCTYCEEESFGNPNGPPDIDDLIALVMSSLLSAEMQAVVIEQLIEHFAD